MFEALSVYIKYVNERTADVKIDRGSYQSRVGCSKSLISLAVGMCSTTGVFWMKMIRLWEYTGEFFSIFVNFSSQDLKGYL